MIFEHGAKAIATCSRRLQLASLKLSIKYQCCGGSLQCSHQKNIRFDCKSASLFTTVNDCGVIEGSFSRTKTSLSDFFLPVRYNRWLVKDMCKSRLLLNDMPVFHEDLFKIRCGRVISGNKQ